MRIRGLLLLLLSLYSPWVTGFASKDLHLIPHNVQEGLELSLQMHTRGQGKGAYSNMPLSIPTVKLKDFVSFSFQASQAGYVSLWNLGTSGKMVRLFPNRFQTNMQVEAGKTYHLGGQTQQFGIRAEGPVGLEHVFLLWTAQQQDQPLQFSAEELNTFRAYEQQQVLEVSQRATQAWATAHLAFEVSEDGQPWLQSLQRRFPAAEQAPLRMQGVHGKVYLLAMGANTQGLAKAGQDAEHFTQAMQQLWGRQLQARLYSDAHVRDFRQGMHWLQQQVTPQDWVIVYYSGHGSTLPDRNGDEADKVDEVFVMADTRGQLAPDLRHVIVDDEFHQTIQAIRSDNIIMILDACYSAGLSKRAQLLLEGRRKFVRMGELGQRLPSEVAKRGARHLVDVSKGVLVYAAAETQSAYESRYGGVMTQYLLAELFNVRNHDENWYNLIQNASHKIANHVKVRPAVVGNIHLLQKIRLVK